MVENLREKVASILHTDNGARVACQCVWHGSTKVTIDATLCCDVMHWLLGQEDYCQVFQDSCLQDLPGREWTHSDLGTV